MALRDAFETLKNDKLPSKSVTYSFLSFFHELYFHFIVVVTQALKKLVSNDLKKLKKRQAKNGGLGMWAPFGVE